MGERGKRREERKITNRRVEEKKRGGLCRKIERDGELGGERVERGRGKRERREKNRA